MSLRRLKWVTVLGPVLFLVALDLVRHGAAREFFHAWPGELLTVGLVLIGALLFSEAVFGVIERAQRRVQVRNRELLALHQAALDITEDLELEEVLQRVVDQARELAGARYGALSVLDREGRIERFITSGITAEERTAIGDPPQGRGLLGDIFQAGRPVRVRRISEHPRSVGFPTHHPPMESFLGVPIRLGEEPIGNLYLTEKAEAEAFDEEDAFTLERFAAHAAVAIANARLHERLRELAIIEERERIAREMHDRPAQVLGFVSTKAQAVRELLAAGRVEEAQRQVESLIDLSQQAYADVRQDILALKSTETGRDFLSGLEDYLERLAEQSGLQVDLETDGLTEGEGRGLGLRPEVELHLLRVIQEALSNVRRHAGVERARLRLEAAPDRVRAVIEDEGKGFRSEGTEPAERSGPQFGLTIMRERVEAVGGSLEIDSEPGRGTRITVEVAKREV